MSEPHFTPHQIAAITRDLERQTGKKLIYIGQVKLPAQLVTRPPGVCHCEDCRQRRRQAERN